ncbi:MAG: pyruvate, water dikinase regulatory protein [Anaerolineae bacterium]|jgi:regulator of PEP synthase PpsR (kinase-PPPase family)
MEQEAGHMVYVVSDATGGTGRRVVEAALAQFSGAEVTVNVVPGIREVEEVKRVIKQAASVGGTIVHTLALPNLRKEVLTEGRRRHVVTIDLMGPLVSRLSECLELSPLARPGLLRQLDESYFERIGAIDFAVRHDDGRNVQELPQAELVLVGVSRTSKTPISIFLAYRGWRVANIPIVSDLEPPPILFQIDRRRVIALTIQPERLVKLRYARANRMTRRVSLDYANKEYVQRELDWAELILHRRRWAKVDVTNKSIEECAAEIIALYERRMGQRS